MEIDPNKRLWLIASDAATMKSPRAKASAVSLARCL
jgi:hypothetical protein